MKSRPRTHIGQLRTIDGKRVRIIAANKERVLVAGESYGGGWVKRSDLRKWVPWPSR